MLMTPLIASLISLSVLSCTKEYMWLHKSIIDE
jgi:hypothetical protein